MALHYLEQGKKTQCFKNHKNKIRVIIGLDFGTAFTKVVIGASLQDRYFVTFDDVPGAKSCLLPCVLSLNAEGRYALGMSDAMSGLVSGLKLSLLRGEPDVQRISQVVLFLAFVLRYVRNWFFQNCAKNYRDVMLDWHLNAGMPAKTWHDERLSRQYLNIFQLAWRLSVSDAELDIEGALTLVKKEGSFSFPLVGEMICPERLGLVPEFVAEIASYTRSPRRHSGLHLLIDVGAATLDVATFNVWTTNEDQDFFPIFKSQVVSLGTHFLCKHVLQDVIPVDGDELYDGYLCFNDNALETSLQKFLIPPDKVDDRFKTFKVEVKKAIAEVYRETRTCRDPNSLCWKTGVPTFVCGGGAKLEFYQKCIRELNWGRSGSGFRLHVMPLTPPDSWRQECYGGDLDFSRLSVAYGLSYEIEDLGRVRPEHEIPDLYTRSTDDDSDARYISKEMT